MKFNDGTQIEDSKSMNARPTTNLDPDCSDSRKNDLITIPLPKVPDTIMKE